MRRVVVVVEGGHGWCRAAPRRASVHPREAAVAMLLMRGEGETSGGERSGIWLRRNGDGEVWRGGKGGGDAQGELERWWEWADVCFFIGLNALYAIYDKYQVGQLYSVAEASKNETGGGEGVEVLKNEPYEKDGEKGQYTHKIYHLQSKVPSFVRMLAPSFSSQHPRESLERISILSLSQVHGLDAETWKKVDVVYIDIADRSQVEPKDYKPEEDPCKFKSVKTGRGPLGPDWKKELPNKKDCPHMCAYKLVTVKFKWWGLQNKVENFIQKQEKRLFTNFHRQLFCWIDKWIDLNMEDIRRMEEETRKELDEMRVKDPVKGMVALED
ncbi:hypothetical protein L3Q82_022269 [Scortum barcoo]|uniref:Uncharacterized protein n=1 Tax=Scortum barcoo TaxID=214431 RepID=A0ACB8X1D2_9TELE|nr:hypothetical protein L3Q82_022269 [Scortum barcoo]